MECFNFVLIEELHLKCDQKHIQIHLCNFLNLVTLIFYRNTRKNSKCCLLYLSKIGLLSLVQFVFWKIGLALRVAKYIDSEGTGTS